jgi:IS30 family transposase
MNYHHLTRDERHTISSLRYKGHSAAFIAEVIGRSKSTLTRELKRNVEPGDRYSHHQAESIARRPTIS